MKDRHRLNLVFLPLLLLGIAALIILPSMVRAQVITATIRGHLIDHQGGVLPGATITARQVATNTTKTVVTTELGQFFMPGLPADKHDLSVTLSGFTAIAREGG